ncbi:FYN-binding protein 1 isoform X1 [Pyrgilauda ruficollis]|uniref:FYN-binding protein 1 isoform X1 n=1 Tax=Pyrgilauda ruficollis TaxID=221976 RepID=UPI001B879630|nr:FYN-binding protein 1 isoform X1 [Pyrgilauda ruficollis]XP_041328553.1 FYN-binding protein 1 isoform X1 [Pyrgilauda ruficollis]
MEKFERCNRDTEDPSNSRPIKIPRKDAAKGLQMRKAIFEECTDKGCTAFPPGPSTLHKPVQSKPPMAVKPSSDDKTDKDPNPPHLKPVTQRFGVQLQPINRGNDEKAGCSKFSIKTSDPSKEDPKPSNPKPAQNKFLAPPNKEKNPLGPKPNLNFASQENEAKPEFSKVAAVKEKLRSATQENEPKPPVSKPPLAQKPSLNNEVSQNENTSYKSGFRQRPSAPRKNIHAHQVAKEMGENSNSAAEAPGSNIPKIALKPTGHGYSLPKGPPKTMADNSEEKGMSAAKNIFLKKITQEEAGSSHKFLKTNMALAAGRPSGESKENEERRSTMPRLKVLPQGLKPSQPPQKPDRPLTVDLEIFQKTCQENSPKNKGLKQKTSSSAALAPPIPPSHTAVPPPPPAFHPSLQVPAAPSLPPRNIKTSSETINLENEENYDDVEFVSQGHGNTQRGQESDGEMYEDINDIRSSRGKEKKQDKEDKRRMDQEKIGQKEKDKKELELRKKFKLTGPIEVLHQARACINYKGGRNELTVKQGDKIEIIRLTNNPEGKWLGRIKGCYGYIKTTMVEIDYDSLKRKQKPSTRAAVKHTEQDQGTYDDVGQQDTTSSQSGDRDGGESMFPPPPSDQDIYDGIDDEDAIARSVSQDEDKNGIWSWGILKRLKVKDGKKKSVREKTAKVNEAEENENLFMSSSTKQSGKDYGDNVYDDVDSSDFSAPPPVSSSSKSVSLGKPKSDAKYGQKLKKMEKEEKEFRKRFKFDSEIKVLYSTTTVQNLSQKRWWYKDLQIKPGESLDIIESTDDTKVLCRNKEGKYGYVLRSNLVQNDGEIYDDIGDDCIYDNDSDAECS